MAAQHDTSVRGYVENLLGAVKALLVLAGLAVFAYLGWFGIRNGLPLSADPATWGQFGDYFGGLINPIVALFALVLLGVGVRIQRETLEAARTELIALKEAAKQDRFIAQFGMLLNLISQVRVQVHAQTIVQEVRDLTSNQHQESASLERAENYLRSSEPLIRPYFSTLTAATHLLRDTSISDAELERHSRVLRGLVSTAEAQVMTIWRATDRITPFEWRLIEQFHLFTYAHENEVSSMETRWEQFVQHRIGLGETPGWLF